MDCAVARGTQKEGNWRVRVNSGVPKGLGGLKPPPPEIPKALQNRAKLNPIVKNVKSC